MNNHPLLFAILIFLVLTTLLSVGALALKIMTGYTGFESFNNKPDLVTLGQNCSNDYFSSKYSSDNILNSMRVSIIASIACLAFSLAQIIIIFVKLNDLNKGQSEERQETEVQQAHFSEVQMNFLENLFSIQSNNLKYALFILISLVILSSFLVFKKFIEYYQQSQSDVCPLKITQSQVLIIVILSCIIMSFSIARMIIFLIILCQITKRLEMLQRENQSLSFKHQVQRIIRQVPESQRRLIKGQNLLKEQIVPKENNRQLNQNESKSKEGEGKQGLIFGMQRVQSVIYNASPSLMLQSTLN